MDRLHSEPGLSAFNNRIVRYYLECDSCFEVFPDIVFPVIDDFGAEIMPAEVGNTLDVPGGWPCPNCGVNVPLQSTSRLVREDRAGRPYVRNAAELGGAEWSAEP